MIRVYVVLLSFPSTHPLRRPSLPLPFSPPSLSFVFKEMHQQMIITILVVLNLTHCGHFPQEYSKRPSRINRHRLYHHCSTLFVFTSILFSLGMAWEIAEQRTNDVAKTVINKAKEKLFDVNLLQTGIASEEVWGGSLFIGNYISFIDTINLTVIYGKMWGGIQPLYTYTSLLEVYKPLLSASGAVHLIGSFFECFVLYISSWVLRSRPKSAIFTALSSPRRTLRAARSRWTNPLLDKYSYDKYKGKRSWRTFKQGRRLIS